MRRTFNSLVVNFDIMDKLRLGYVEGEVAVRVTAVMEVRGWSAAEFTREAVKSFLSALEVQDEARQRADGVLDKTIPLRRVEGLGLCLICDDGPCTLEQFANMVREAMRKN